MESHWKKEKCPGEGRRAGNLLQGLQVPSQRQLQRALSFGWVHKRIGQRMHHLETVVVHAKQLCVFSVNGLPCLQAEWGKSEDKRAPCQQAGSDLDARGCSLHCCLFPRNACSAVQARQALQSYKNFWVSPVDQHTLFFLSLCERQAPKQIIYWRLIFDVLPVCSAR